MGLLIAEDKMKVKFLILVFLITLLTAVSLPQAPATAQEQTNLFNNPGFEAGYYNQDSISQIAVPNGWRMHWLDNVAFEGTEGLPAYRPETVVWNIQDAPPAEQPLFFRDGAYTLKIFKGWAPMYAAISQDVSGLEVGRSYRISAPVYIDIVADYEGGNKVAPWRQDSGFVQFGAAPVGTPWLDFANINYSGYWTAETINPYYLSQPIFVWDFVATASDMTIWIEVGSRHPYPNNGFFIDGVGLFALDASGQVTTVSGGGGGGGSSSGPVAPLPTVEPPEPNADGSITHIVSGTDTLWTLAIQYAPIMGVTPEQALPLIQEQNNNPAFIFQGQELIIVPASGNAPVVEEEATEEETAVEETADDSETAAEEAADEEAVTEEAEAEAEVETAVEEAAEEVAAAPANAICVTVYQDANANGSWDDSSEGLQANAAVTLFQGGDAISTQISDGVNESYCFNNLEANTYQVQVSPPADYAVTSDASWAIALAGGNTVPVSFGMQEIAELTNEIDATDAPVVEEELVSEEAAPETQLDANEGGFFSSVGGIVLIIALILILLAAAGVAMLRRG